MPDRLALYPQEVRGAAIERAILDLEATAWDRTPGETFPSAPETHAASFVLLEGERAVCHVGIRRARLLHRGQSYAVCGLSEVVTHPLRRGQGLATALCLRAGARRPLRQGGLGANPGRLPRGGNARGALSQRRSGTRDAGHVPLPARTGICGGFCARGHRSGVGERTALVKNAPPRFRSFGSAGARWILGEKGGITPPQTRGERSPSPPGARFPRGFPPSGWRRRRTRPARSSARRPSRCSARRRAA